MGRKLDFNPDSYNLKDSKEGQFDKQCTDCNFWVKDPKHKEHGKKCRFCPANTTDYKLCTDCKRGGASKKHHKTGSSDCPKKNGGGDKKKGNDRDGNTKGNDRDGNKDRTAGSGSHRMRGIIAEPVATHANFNKSEKSKISEIPYCANCNIADSHWTHQCIDIHSIARRNQSRFGCTACHERGHTIDECRCPVAKPCTKCARKGHLPEECSSNKEASVYDQYFNKIGWARRDSRGKRFEWESRDGLQLTLNEAQLMREQWMLDQQEFLAQGMVFSDEYKREREQAIEDAERACFDIKLQVVDDMTGIIPSGQAYARRLSYARSRVNATAVPNARIPSTTSYNRPSLATKTSSGSSSINAQYNADLAVIRQMAAKGASRETCHQYELALHAMRKSQISQLELAVRNKCSTSRALSTLQNMNYKILSNERSILEKGVLSPAKMSQLKYALYQGIQIYRDPKALESLFARHVPRCHCCGSEGVFVDRHFSQIPWDRTTSELLMLEEIADWGVFVVFDCRGRCSTQGFSYERRFVSDEVDYEMDGDLERRAWEF